MMKRNKSFVLMLLGASLAWAACGHSGPGEMPKADPAPIMSQPKKPAPKAAFDRETLDVGRVQMDVEHEWTFQLRNEGPGKLAIETVKWSGGPCVCDHYPHDSLAIDSIAYIRMMCRFSTAGIFKKSIVVTSNTEPRNKVLHVQGEAVE